MDEEKAKMVRAFHRSLIKVISIRDSFIEIQNKIKIDPEDFDTHGLHEATKDLSSSQMEMESLWNLQISEIVSNVSKPKILEIEKLWRRSKNSWI